MQYRAAGFSIDVPNSVANYLVTFSLPFLDNIPVSVNAAFNRFNNFKSR